MSGLSNTQRTLNQLKLDNVPCDIVERWIQFAPSDPRRKFAPGMRKDCFDIFDILAIKPDGIFGIQVCGSDFAAHDRKILGNKHAPGWIKSRGGIELWGWRKVKLKRGGKATRWKARIKIYKLEDFK